MKKSFAFLAVVASIGLTSASFAQGRDNDRREDNARGGGPARHSAANRNFKPERHEGPSRQDEFAYGARGPEWHRGGRIPPTYRGRQYVVSDWRAHHLRQPPRGYQWVQVGGDYVLAAIATGVIADLLINH